jgi:hypothetical protein
MNALMEKIKTLIISFDGESLLGSLALVSVDACSDIIDNPELEKSISHYGGINHCCKIAEKPTLACSSIFLLSNLSYMRLMEMAFNQETAFDMCISRTLSFKTCRNPIHLMIGFHPMYCHTCMLLRAMHHCHVR